MTRAYRKKQQALAAEQAEITAKLLAEQILAGVIGDPAEGPTMPSGLYEMLQLKNVLQDELRHAIEKPIVVSVDLVNDEWAFLVRGYKPPFSRWRGRDVIYLRSRSMGLDHVLGS